MDNEIIDKIEKLMNLAARAGTEGEAKAAFAMASKLMTKHGIEQHQITGRDNTAMNKAAQEAEVTRVDIQCEVHATERPYHLYVRQVIRHCFKVAVIAVKYTHRSPDYYMLGSRADCVFAAYAFDMLSKTFLKHVGAYLKANGLPRTPRYFNGYWDGLRIGFCQAWDEAQRNEIRDQKCDSYAIVLVDKEKALTVALNNIKNLKYNRDRRNPDAMARMQVSPTAARSASTVRWKPARRIRRFAKMNPAQELAKMQEQLVSMVLAMSEVISKATNTRPGLSAAIALLTAQRKLAEAASAVEAAKDAVV